MSSLSSLLKAMRRPFGKPGLGQEVPCPVCKTPAAHLDSVDFNKTCEELRGLKLATSGVLVRYYLCGRCGFCFAPEFSSWTFRDFEERIYNGDYATVDPDYRLARPKSNAELLAKTFDGTKIRHMDYGGGSGLLSETLRAKGWDSHTYDPFVDRSIRVAQLGRFDLVTAFEVFEHVPDIGALFEDLQALVEPNGLILFSTLLSDGEIRPGEPLRWWYASPRNGHISLFSKESLSLCMTQQGFKFASASANLHIAHRQIPAWASHILAPIPAPAAAR